MTYDVFVVGGGPSGATAAEDLARAGHSAWRCWTGPGGSSPAAARSRRALIQDFDIPDESDRRQDQHARA